jgi:hypothetical protein
MAADNTAKISHDEMISMFGQAMPLEAVTLLFNSPHEKTIGEIRAELRKIAKTRRIEAAHGEDILALRARCEELQAQNERLLDTVGLRDKAIHDQGRTIAALKAQAERLIAKEGKRISDELLRTDRQAGSLTDEQYAAAVQPYGEKDKPLPQPRKDANGNPIPWAKEHDYFMAFDPNDPDTPTD